MKKRVVIWLLAAALLCALCAHALAEETIHVSTWEELRNAINSAPNGQVREIR